VAGGQQQLLRYMNNISSNRWLLMKVFAVLIVFIILWSVIA
jgi:syntaxin 5